MNTVSSLSTDTLLTAFENHLQNCCGITETSCAVYARHARKFLEGIYPRETVDWTRLKPIHVLDFISEQAARYKPKTAKMAATALHSFLRFLHLHGLCARKLVESIPTIPAWSLSNFPTVLSDNQLQTLLSSFDCTKATGLRGRAMALCLAQLGLRAGEVAQLSLENICWRVGTLRILSQKTRRENILPLTQDVGSALVAYLENGRPPTICRQVFVRHLSPVGAPISADVVRAVIRRGFERVGIQTASKGTHILRRTAATRMLQQGASLKEIADILGHQSLDTTIIYTQINTPSLAEIALPWPEVQP